MGKKMKLPLRFKATVTTWTWPNCATTHPRTLSFRTTTANQVLKADSSIRRGLSTDDDDDLEEEDGESGGGEMVIIRGGLRSDRLFFEPGETSSSILEASSKTYNNNNNSNGFPFKESVVMAMDSNDPFVDFRRSMEEMVVAHGLKDWDCLEKLLTCYLKVNGKSNHGYIVGAFVDLLVGLAFVNDDYDCDHNIIVDNIPSSSSSSTATTSTAAHSFTSPLSFSSSTTTTTTTCSTSPCISLLGAEEEEIEKAVVDSASCSNSS